MKFAAGERMKAFDLKANKTENPIAKCSLPLAYGAHDQ